MKNNKIIKISLLIILVTFMSLFPIDIMAKELVCEYNYEGKELRYILKNNKLENPVKDGKIIANKKWYNSEDFNLVFSASSNNKVCPNIVVEDNDSFNTVFANYRDEKDCNGKCTTLTATNEVLKVNETKSLSAVGIYKSDDFFIPTVRKLSNNKIEWSIDNANYYEINEDIKLNNNSIVKIDEKLVKNLFTNNDKSAKIYRCVFTSGKKLIYNLQEDENSCKNDLSKNDNQGFIANSYNGNKGAGNCKNTILGDPKNEDSVAWLLQQLLNYLRILGPMIILIMSAVDFAKAIVMGDDETMQKCYKKLIKRLLLAILLFFVPSLVTILLEIFGFVGDPICVLD